MGLWSKDMVEIKCLFVSRFFRRGSFKGEMVRSKCTGYFYVPYIPGTVLFILYAVYRCTGTVP